VRQGELAAQAKARAKDDPQAYVLLIDEADRPLGWIAHRDIPEYGELVEAMANPVSPTVNRRTTLKDALSMMLDADVQTGIVVDRNGAVQGLLTVEAVAQKMRKASTRRRSTRPTRRSGRPDVAPSRARPTSPPLRSGRCLRRAGFMEISVDGTGCQPFGRCDALPPASPAGRHRRRRRVRHRPDPRGLVLPRPTVYGPDHRPDWPALHDPEPAASPCSGRSRA
jgi:CBS domain-containing protein